MSARGTSVVVFDLGGVLIDWNPRHLYRKLIDDEAAMERFLAEICTQAWNERQDEGRSTAEATAELVARHPDRRALIEAYYDRWDEMLGGEVEGTVAVLEALKAAGHELHALTNWSAETFPFARRRHAFLDHFATILVSGEVGLKKPDPRIFELLLGRIGHPAEACLFIDDSARNRAAAEALGFDVIPFQDAEGLEGALLARGLLASRA
jgi:2-haloacid dehalogenase